MYLVHLSISNLISHHPYPMLSLRTIYQKDLTTSLLDKLAVFLEEGFPTDSTELWLKRFSVWWDSNPAVSETTPCGWMLADFDDLTIYGFRGNIPVTYQHNHERLLGSASTAWYVSKDFRREYSTKIFEQQLLMDGVDLFVATTPAPPVKKRMLKNGFHVINEGESTTIYLTLTNMHLFSSQLSKKFAREAIVKRGRDYRITKILATGFSVVSRCLPRPGSRGKTLVQSDGKYEIRQCCDVAEFLPYVSRHQEVGSVEYAKDVNTLHWLLFSQEIQTLLSRTVNLLFTTSGEYVGYFIYDLEQMYGEKTLRIREMKLLCDDMGILSLIIKHAKTVARNNACSGVFVTVLSPEFELYGLLEKKFLLKIRSEGRYCVLFRSGGDDMYLRYRMSDLDPDGGVI